MSSLQLAAYREGYEQGRHDAMSKLGKKLLKGVKQINEFMVHPGSQPVMVAKESVVISVEHYKMLKELATESELAKLNDDKFAKVTELKLKAACKVIRKELPRYIEAKSAAGISFRDGYEDVVSKALVAAAFVRMDNDA